MKSNGPESARWSSLVHYPYAHDAMVLSVTVFLFHSLCPSPSLSFSVSDSLCLLIVFHAIFLIPRPLYSYCAIMPIVSCMVFKMAKEKRRRTKASWTPALRAVLWDIKRHSSSEWNCTSLKSRTHHKLTHTHLHMIPADSPLFILILWPSIVSSRLASSRSLFLSLYSLLLLCSSFYRTILPFECKVHLTEPIMMLHLETFGPWAHTYAP